MQTKTEPAGDDEQAIAVSESDECARGPDALGLIVVSFTNVEGSEAQLVRSEPAPPATDDLNYSTFLGKICDTFGKRYHMPP